MLKVQVINKSHNELPEYSTSQSVGMDVRANIESPITLRSLERAMIPTGLYCAVPNGYEMRVQPRSGLAAKHGITILNTPGEVDPDYRGEVKVILINLSNEPFTIYPSDRIAQIIFTKIERVEWESVHELDKTERNGGFGSTGVK